MFDRIDESYYLQRIAQEKALASQSVDFAVARTHQELQANYERKLRDLYAGATDAYYV